MLSLSLIVRDASVTLGPCLASIKPWVDELIVVDTGSVDDTVAIAESHGAQVFHFPWCDDFAAARNVSLEKARGEWIFWMDADDVIDAENGRKLRQIVSGDVPPEVLGFVMQVKCPMTARAEGPATVVDHIKLVRNRPDVRFEGRIHEQILPSIRRTGGEVAWTDVCVVHANSDRSPAGRAKKSARDLRLLEHSSGCSVTAGCRRASSDWGDVLLLLPHRPRRLTHSRPVPRQHHAVGR